MRMPAIAKSGTGIAPGEDVDDAENVIVARFDAPGGQLV
jgi:hypothetical protein